MFFFLNFFYSAQASIKDEIISNFKKIENLSFSFKQTIDENTEEGECIIQYPKKIYCNYNNTKKKNYCFKWKIFSNKKSSNKSIF